MHYITGENSTLLFYVNSELIAFITYTDLIPDGLFNSLGSDEEEEVIEGIEDAETTLHLGYLMIYDEFRGKGYMDEIIKLYHNYAKYKGYSKSSLVCEPCLTNVYERCGYEKIYHLKSSEMDVMVANI